MFPIRDIIPSRTFPFVTIFLIVLNSAIFYLELSLSPLALTRLIYLFGVVPARAVHPDWAVWFGVPLDNYWPYLTSQFLHGGWLHIIGNMWSLWLFGDNVEDRMGHARFFLFYILCGLASGLVHSYTNAASNLPTIGASGAIAGVMGAYLILYPASRIVTLIFIIIFPVLIEVPAIIYLGLWFVLQLFSGTLSLASRAAFSGIAFWAHVGGFISGIIFLPLLAKSRRAYRRWYRDET